MSNVSESPRSLTKNERCERIAQFAHQKKSTMRDSLRLLTMKVSESLIFFAKDKQFAQKTNDRIPNPASLLFEYEIKRKSENFVWRD